MLSGSVRRGKTEPDGTIGRFALGTKANCARLARGLLAVFLSRSAAWLSIGQLDSSQCDRPMMKHVVLEITPSGAES